jgi:hypothetical protein
MSAGLRGEIEGLRQLGMVEQPSEEARERMLESIFLNGMTEFESFLEDIFLAAVCRQIRPGKTKTRVAFPDVDTARALLLRPNDSYLAWLPIHHSLDRAGQFLHDGAPFSRIGSRSWATDRLNVASAVRNAVAHKSSSARKRFEDATSARYDSPGEYLAAQLGEGSVCDGFLADFVRFGQALCVSEAEAGALLGPEDPYPTGKKLEPGAYRCSGCGTEYVLSRKGALACSVCDPPCGACGAITSQAATFRQI